MLTFESLPSPERHISRLATIGTLFGLEVTNPESAKVLEIACGTGRNLIPQATQYPNAYFYGFDFDPKSIEKAVYFKELLKLTNINFEEKSIQAYNNFKDKFDYIICHGFFSWVPENLRATILKVCKNCLSDNGIVYISHNALPGWFERSKIQQLLIRDSSKKSQEEQVADAKRMLNNRLINQQYESEKQKIEIENCLKQSDAFIFHELLNPDTRAYHLSQISELTAKENLYYLGDSLPKRMRYPRFEEIIQFELEGDKKRLRLYTRIQKEQYIDQLYSLSFRGSIFCHKNLSNDCIDFSKLQNLYLSSPLLPKENQIDIFSDLPVTFFGPQESSAEINKAFMKAFFLNFRQTWPNPVPFSELYSLAEKLSGQSMDINELCQELSVFFCFGLLEVSLKDLPNFAKDLKDNCLSKFTKLEAQESSWLTSRKHEFLPIDDFDRSLINLLDQETSIEELEEKILNLIKENKLSVQKNKDTVSDSEIKVLVKETIKTRLAWYYEQALL
jgi:methyltransferase-like protein/SAM-dependent methyltransferase